MSDDRRVLRSGDATVEVVPPRGGRVGQILVGSTALLHAGDAATQAGDLGWGSFPMAPWVGRIRHGRFRFLGEDITLECNHRDGPADGAVGPPDAASTDAEHDVLNDPADARRHAMHGTVFARPWQVVDATSTTLEMRCELGPALHWPYGGVAHQGLELHDDRLVSTLSVTADTRTFPADVGWHPWFVKPDALSFDPAAMYRRDEIGVATPDLVPPGPPPWDDCFVNRRPVTLRYDRRDAAVVTVSSDCDHLVVFDEPEHATCVEPQSGPPDSPNIRPRPLGPGESLTRTMTIAWS